MTLRNMSRESMLAIAISVLAFLILIVPYTSIAADLNRIAAAEAVRLPSPNQSLSEFAQFELAPMSISAEIRADNGKMERSRELERKLKAKLVPLLDHWNEAASDSGRGILIIRPRLEKLRIVSGGARLWGGAFTGSSFVDLELVLYDAINDKEVSRVLIKRSSTQDAEFTLGNANDERVIDLVAAIAHEYLVRNGESKGSTGFASASKHSESIRALFAGNTRSGETRKKSEYHVYHAPDGKIYGITTTKWNNEYTDTGTWQIDDAGHYCREWEKWQESKYECFVVTAIGDGRYAAVEAGGGDDWVFDIRPGDPEGLDKSPVARVRLTGNYVSENTGTDSKRFLSKYTGGKVSLVQKGNGVTGTYGDSGRISGVIKGRTISFDWWGIPREGTGVGQWVVNSDGTELTGTWVSSGRHYSGTWNLTRID